MSQKLPFFSEAFELDALNQYYDTQTSFAGRIVTVDINFEESICDDERFDAVRKFLNKLQDVVTVARRSIRQEYAKGDEVARFMRLHLDELDEDEIEDLTKNAHASQSTEEQLISALLLTRVGFYPDDEKHFAVLDFSFGEAISNYLLAVNFNSGMNLESVVMES